MFSIRLLVVYDVRMYKKIIEIGICDNVVNIFRKIRLIDFIYCLYY